MLRAGSVINNKYRIINTIGKGGMSTVYLAVHEILGVHRAIKEIHVKNELLRQHLIREADILRKLRHPGLPMIIDVVIENNDILIIMEYIQGRTLKDVLTAEEYIKEEQAILWGKQICDVLIYLHTRKPPIIYRDLNPSNLIINPDGDIVLVDFGTAKEYENKKNQEDIICFGTRGYAAPEQYEERGQTDERTDIYCFGLTMYHLLTGKNPEEQRYPLYSRCFRKQEFSADLEKIIKRCVRKKPEERYHDCRELAYDLEHLEEGSRTYRRKEIKKVMLFLWFTAGAVISSFGYVWCRQLIEVWRYDSAKAYVRQAEKSMDGSTKRESYKKALYLLPGEEEIYQSILKTYVHPNNFVLEDAAELIHILGMTEENSTGQLVLEVFRKENPDGYCEFCYTVGIAYFYYMEGLTGKKEAQSWFQDVIQVQTKKFSKQKKKRAALYFDIAAYYKTFIADGQDKSGENKAGGYKTFYHTLTRLNKIEVHKNSEDAEAAAAYLISLEVAAEIAAFALEFIDKGEITAVQLNKELDKIMGKRIYILKEFRNKEEIDNLKELVDEARKNIMIAEGDKKWDR